MYLINLKRRFSLSFVKLLVLGGITILFLTVSVTFLIFSDINFAAISWKNNSFTNLLINNSISQQLQSDQSILCFVTTSLKNEDTKARAVNTTWGRRCDKLIFVTSYISTKLDALVVDAGEGRNHLTAKTMKALEYIYQYYINDFDFFVKADDDTYIIIENLHLLLSRFKPHEPVYLGYHFRVNVNQGYMSGGGSYVLSRGALRTMVENGIQKNLCAEDGNDEDIDVGKCLENVGVSPYVSYDKFGRDAFHVTDVKSAVVGPLLKFLKQYPEHHAKAGPECCSQFSISFHYISADMMYIMDFLLYRISVFGWDTDYNNVQDIFSKRKAVINHKNKDEVFYASRSFFDEPYIPV